MTCNCDFQNATARRRLIDHTTGARAPVPRASGSRHPGTHPAVGHQPATGRNPTGRSFATDRSPGQSLSGITPCAGTAHRQSTGRLVTPSPRQHTPPRPSPSLLQGICSCRAPSGSAGRPGHAVSDHRFRGAGHPRPVRAMRVLPSHANRRPTKTPPTWGGVDRRRVGVSGSVRTARQPIGHSIYAPGRVVCRHRPRQLVGARLRWSRMLEGNRSQERVFRSRTTHATVNRSHARTERPMPVIPRANSRTSLWKSLPKIRSAPRALGPREGPGKGERAGESWVQPTSSMPVLVVSDDEGRGPVRLRTCAALRVDALQAQGGAQGVIDDFGALAAATGAEAAPPAHEDEGASEVDLDGGLVPAGVILPSGGARGAGDGEHGAASIERRPRGAGPVAGHWRPAGFVGEVTRCPGRAQGYPPLSKRISSSCCMTASSPADVVSMSSGVRRPNFGSGRRIQARTWMASLRVRSAATSRQSRR